MGGHFIPVGGSCAQVLTCRCTGRTALAQARVERTGACASSHIATPCAQTIGVNDLNRLRRTLCDTVLALRQCRRSRRSAREAAPRIALHVSQLASSFGAILGHLR